jgi:RHS repeat-associated protein
MYDGAGRLGRRCLGTAVAVERRVGRRRVGINAALYGKGEAVGMNRLDVESYQGGKVYFGKDVLGSVRGVPNEYGVLEGRREYKAELARFTTEDPVRDGVNWFAYANNDPVNYIDLWGLSASDKPQEFQPLQYVPGYSQSLTIEIEMGGIVFTKMEEKLDIYHEQGQPKNGVDPALNNKFVSPDGLLEVVYDEKGRLVTDPVNMGKNNKVRSITNQIGHVIVDVIPYIFLGNSPDDPTK